MNGKQEGRGAASLRWVSGRWRSCVSHLEKIMVVVRAGVSNEKSLRRLLMCRAWGPATQENDIVILSLRRY